MNLDYALLLVVFGTQLRIGPDLTWVRPFVHHYVMSTFQAKLNLNLVSHEGNVA